MREKQKLLTWLKDRYCDQEAARVEAITSDMNLAKELCAIFGIELKEEAEEVDMEFVERRKAKKTELLQLGATKELLDNIDHVALNQEDLIDCLDSNYKTIYLAQGRFEIPLSVPDVTYIGIFDPTVIIKATDNVDFASKHLTFQDVKYFWDATGVTPADKMYQAEQLMISGKFKEAKAMLEEIKYLGNPRALWMLEQLCRYYGDYDTKFDYDNFTMTNPLDVYLPEFIRMAQLGTPMDMYMLAEEYNYWGPDEESEQKRQSIRMEWLRKAAEHGCVMAMYDLGDYYESWGDDEENAMHWYRKAAEFGHKVAQREIGLRYRDGSGVQQNDEQAMSWFKKAAYQDDAVAQYCLGDYYLRGYGNPKIGVYYLQKAAESGVTAAQWKLGECYADGKGVAQDEVEAEKWFVQAATGDYQHDDADYMNQLGVKYSQGAGVRQNYYKAFECFQKAADKEYDWGMYNLAQCCYDGDGTEQDYEQAVYWYRKAAEQGLVDAQWELGECYADGKGVTQDEVQAERWFKNAAESALESGDANYMNQLGVRYAFGDGVPQDDYKAFECYQEAAEAGHDWGMYNLGCCYFNGRGVEQNYEQAVYWLNESAEQELPMAEYDLGGCYYNGDGVEEDKHSGVTLIQSAYFHGHEKAKEWLDKRTEEGWYRNCPYCKYHADLTATTCPHCGADL